MKMIKFIGAAFALSISGVAMAAPADCCKGMECCKEKDGKKSCCCDDMKKSGDHAGHDMPDAPKK